MLDVFLLSQLQEAEQGNGLVFRPGGSAANTACWLAKLGQRVSFVGCTGDDALGQALATEIAEHGVLMHAHQIEEKETGGVAIQIVDEGERVMRSSRGANEALSPERILSAARFEPAYIHLTGYSLLGPYGLEILWAAHQLAVACESVLALDPSSRGVIQRFTAERLLEALADKMPPAAESVGSGLPDPDVEPLESEAPADVAATHGPSAVAIAAAEGEVDLDVSHPTVAPPDEVPAGIPVANAPSEIPGLVKKALRR